MLDGWSMIEECATNIPLWCGRYLSRIPFSSLCRATYTPSFGDYPISEVEERSVLRKKRGRVTVHRLETAVIG